MPTPLRVLSILGLLVVGATAQLTSIDLYGVRSVDEQRVRETLGLEIGDELGDRDALEAAIAALPGVAACEVSLIRYPGAAALFVGVREEGTPVVAWQPAPEGDVRLEPTMLALYQHAGELLMPAIRSGQAGEDHDAGHSLSHHAPLREIQEGYVIAADMRYGHLADVLRQSSDAASRAAAASILAYASDKAAVARDLQAAVRDPDMAVRNNAVRALSILGRYAQDHPELAIDVDPTPFLELIESLTWTDRNKGGAALDALSAGRDPQLLAALAERSVDALAEMACWHSSGHAGFGLRVLARVAGVPEEQVQARSQALWDDREARVAWVDELLAALAARPPAAPAEPSGASR